MNKSNYDFICVKDHNKQFHSIMCLVCYGVPLKHYTISEEMPFILWPNVTLSSTQFIFLRSFPSCSEGGGFVNILHEVIVSCVTQWRNVCLVKQGFTRSLSVFVSFLCLPLTCLWIQALFEHCVKQSYFHSLVALVASVNTYAPIDCICNTFPCPWL